PSELADLERKLADITKAIGRLVDAVERGEGEADELTTRLRERTKEKQQLELRKSELEAEASAPDGPPTREWIEAKLHDLHAVLKSGGADANAALKALVGGRITVEEASSPGRKRKHLVARFTLTTLAI